MQLMAALQNLKRRRLDLSAQCSTAFRVVAKNHEERGRRRSRVKWDPMARI